MFQEVGPWCLFTHLYFAADVRVSEESTLSTCGHTRQYILYKVLEDSMMQQTLGISLNKWIQSSSWKSSSKTLFVIQQQQLMVCIAYS